MAPTLRGQANAKIRKFPSLASSSLASGSMATSNASRVSRQSWSKPSPRNHHHHHHSRNHPHNDAETPRSGVISRGGDDIEERDNYTGMVVSASSHGASSRGSRDSGHHPSSWGGGGGGRGRSSPFLHDQEEEGRDDVESVQRGEDMEERDADGISSMLSLKFALLQGPQTLSAGLKASSDETHATHDTSETTAASICERGTPFDESSEDGSVDKAASSARPATTYKRSSLGSFVDFSKAACLGRPMLLPSRSDLREAIGIASRTELKDVLLGACRRDNTMDHFGCGRCPSDEAPSFGDNLSILDSHSHDSMSWESVDSSSVEGENEGLNSPSMQQAVKSATFDDQPDDCQPKPRQALVCITPTNQRGTESFEITTNYTASSSMVVELGHHGSPVKDDDDHASIEGDDQPSKNSAETAKRVLDGIVSPNMPNGQLQVERLSSIEEEENIPIAASEVLKPIKSEDKDESATANDRSLHGRSLSQESTTTDFSFFVRDRGLVLPYTSIDEGDLSLLGNIDLPTDKAIFASINHMVRNKRKPIVLQERETVDEHEDTRDDVSYTARDDHRTETKESREENIWDGVVEDDPLQSWTSEPNKSDEDLLITIRSNDQTESKASNNPSNIAHLDETPSVQNDTLDYIGESMSNTADHEEVVKTTLAVELTEAPSSPLPILPEPQKVGGRAIYSFYVPPPRDEPAEMETIVVLENPEDEDPLACPDKEELGLLVSEEKENPEDETEDPSCVDDLILQWVSDGSKADSKKEIPEEKSSAPRPEPVLWDETPRYLEFCEGRHKEGSKSGRSEQNTVSSLGDPDAVSIVTGGRFQSDQKMSEVPEDELICNPLVSELSTIASCNVLIGKRACSGLGSEPHPSLEDSTRKQPTASRLPDLLDATTGEGPENEIDQITMGSRNCNEWQDKKSLVAVNPSADKPQAKLLDTEFPVSKLDDPDLGKIIKGSRSRKVAKLEATNQYQDLDDQTHPSFESMAEPNHKSTTADAGAPTLASGNSTVGLDEKRQMIVENERTEPPPIENPSSTTQQKVWSFYEPDQEQSGESIFVLKQEEPTVLKDEKESEDQICLIQLQETKDQTLDEASAHIELREESNTAANESGKGNQSGISRHEICRTDSGDSTLEGSAHIRLIDGIENKAINRDTRKLGPPVVTDLVSEEVEKRKVVNETDSLVNVSRALSQNDSKKLKRTSSVDEESSNKIDSCHEISANGRSLHEGPSLDEGHVVICTKNSDAPSLDEAISVKPAPMRKRNDGKVSSRLLPTPNKQKTFASKLPLPPSRQQKEFAASNQPPRKTNKKDRRKAGRSGENREESGENREESGENREESGRYGENREESGKHSSPLRMKESAVDSTGSSFILIKRPLSPKTGLKHCGLESQQLGNEVDEAPSMDEGHQHTCLQSDSASVNESSIDGTRGNTARRAVDRLDFEDLIVSTHMLISTGEWVDSPRDDLQPSVNDIENNGELSTSQDVGGARCTSDFTYR
jgi:hypothetical protein